MTLRDDHLRIAVGYRTIALSRASGEALIERLHRHDSMCDVREALEQHGPPTTVRLTAAQEASLVGIIDTWAVDVDGAASLPPGILRLRDALRDPSPERTDGHPRATPDESRHAR